MKTALTTAVFFLAVKCCPSDLNVCHGLVLYLSTCVLDLVLQSNISKQSTFLFPRSVELLRIELLNGNYIVTKPKVAPAKLCDCEVNLSIFRFRLCSDVAYTKMVSISNSRTSKDVLHQTIWNKIFEYRR